MSTRQMREYFEAQFEEHVDHGFLYRRNQKGKPIPITAHERERFVHQYVWRIRFVMAGMMVVIVAFVGLLVWWATSSHSEFPDVAIYFGIGTVVVASIALTHWVAGAPARELEGRSSIGSERSKDEMRAVFFRKLSYGQLAGTAAVGAVLPFTLKSHPDVFHGWGRLWLLLGATLTLVAVVQAFRKWRFEANHPDNMI